jgi:hypothetical protein
MTITRRGMFKGVAVLLLAALAILAYLLSSDDARKQVESTRKRLRDQGFKTELSEFDFRIPPEAQSRAAALTNIDQPNPTNAPVRNESLRQALLSQIAPDPPVRMGSNAAVVVWKLETLAPDLTAAAYLRSQGDASSDIWPALRREFDPGRSLLRAESAATRSGPIRFHLDAERGAGLLLPHLIQMKSLVREFAARALLNLHDGKKDDAWTNLLACSRLVTAWNPEPATVSHLVRFALVATAYEALWQALQSDGWSEERLEALQKEWEAADFFGGLPDTEAFSRASCVRTCQLERLEPRPPPPRISFKQALRSPLAAWNSWLNNWRQRRYRQQGTYEDEKALLLYYWHRELDLREALSCTSWIQMRQTAAVTNRVPFQSPHFSATVAMMNSRELSLRMAARDGGGPLDCAAAAESRRRLLVTALALERYRKHHGTYPQTLGELTPGFLKSPALDFIDGRPLRYRRAENGRFLLYSVGLDGVDNGGALPPPEEAKRRSIPGPSAANRNGVDLVWLLPASEDEARAHQASQLQALRQSHMRQEEAWTEEQWRDTARKQSLVKRLLGTKAVVPSYPPPYQGRPLCETLRNPESCGTNQPTMDELLALRPVANPEHPERMTFALPIAYDVLTNVGRLKLLVDPIVIESSNDESAAQLYEFRRADNGDCLLVWHTFYEAPGEHVLQADLSVNAARGPDKEILGPLLPTQVTNLCQFSLSSATFEPGFGGTFRVKLPEPKATCVLQVFSTQGKLLATLTGETADGQLKIFWDLTDGAGHRFTDNAFDTKFQFTFPDSGRSQTLWGP